MFMKPLMSQNRTMLWHGTKTENLVSIFNGGLLVNAPHAVRCGSSFGNGIYLADTFQKSWSYTGAPSTESTLYIYFHTVIYLSIMIQRSLVILLISH